MLKQRSVSVLAGGLLACLASWPALGAAPEPERTFAPAETPGFDAGLARTLAAVRAEDWALAMDALEQLDASSDARVRALWKRIESQLSSRLESITRTGTLDSLEARFKLLPLLRRAQHGLVAAAPQAPTPAPTDTADATLQRAGELVSAGFLQEARALLAKLAESGPDAQGRIVRLQAAIDEREAEAAQPATKPSTESGSEPADEPTIEPTTRPTPKLAPRRHAAAIPPFKPPDAHYRKYKINRDFLKRFNYWIDALNQNVADGKPYSDLSSQLSLINEAGLDLAETYPPAMEKLRGVLSRYADPIRQHGMIYYGTRGSLELKVGGSTLTNASLAGGFEGGPAPPGHETILCWLKNYNANYEPSGAKLYAITLDGTQLEALDRWDLLREPLWTWIDTHGGIDRFLMPERVLADATVKFTQVFPREVVGNVRKLVYTHGDYRLEVPIWGNML